MADLEAVSCTNAWVLLYWEIPAGVTRYRIHRTDVTAGGAEARIFDSQGHGGANGRRTPPMMVPQGTANSTVPADARIGRFFPRAFTATENVIFRMVRRNGAAGSPMAAVRGDQSMVAINSSLDGLVACWRPQYGGGGAAGPLWIESLDMSQPRQQLAWKPEFQFDESDAANVRFAMKRYGYYVDQAAGASPLSDGHRLRYRVQHRVGSAWTDRTVELQHDWQFPAKLAFFLDNGDDFMHERVWYDGTTVKPYCDTYGLIRVRRGGGTMPTWVVVGTRYDHASVGAGSRAVYYCANAADHKQWDRVIPQTEGANGTLTKVANGFGGHHDTANLGRFTSLLLPTNATGWAWGSADANNNPLARSDVVGNRRALVVLQPYAARAGDTARCTRFMTSVLSHEYTHLNFHRGFFNRTNTHDGTELSRDNILNEGSGFFSEDFVDKFTEIFTVTRMPSQNNWENMFLCYAWPTGADNLYARGLSWVLYNSNRHRRRNAIGGWTYANIPRAWGPAGSPANGYAPYFREFSLAMMMNGFMPDDAPLPLPGYTGATPGSTPDELAVSLKRKDSADGNYISNAQMLRDWTIPSHMFGHGRAGGIPYPELMRSTPDLHNRTTANHYTRQMQIAHASAFFAGFEPMPDGIKGVLHVEMRIAGGNPGRIRRVMATAQRRPAAGGDPVWEYQEVNSGNHTLLAFNDFGRGIERVHVCVPTERPVPLSAGTWAAVPRVTLPWTYYVTLRPKVRAMGLVPRHGYRGGEHIVLRRSSPDADPETFTYVAPEQHWPWVWFNQGMDEGRTFHAVLADDSDVNMPRKDYRRLAVTRDLWRGELVQLAAPNARDGETVRFEIGRATLAGTTINGGVRSFAAVYLDSRPERTPRVAPEPERDFRAILDTAPPTIDSVRYRNGDGVEGALADGVNLMGVVKLEVRATDNTSGVAALELLSRPRGSRSVFTAGRKVLAPDPEGHYPSSVTEEFYWNTYAGNNGPVDLEVMIADRVGNIVRRTFQGAIVRNPRPGARVEGGSLEDDAPATAPTLNVASTQHDGGTGSFRALAADAPARGVLRFNLAGTAGSPFAQLVVSAQTGTGRAAEEIWSEWLPAAGDVTKQWDVDSRALPDGTVTLSFVLKDEAGTESPAATFRFIAANRPPRILPLEPRLTTRGTIDIYGYVDDRCAPAVNTGTMRATWVPAAHGSHPVPQRLADFPGGSYLRRAGMSPLSAPASGWAEGPGEMRFTSAGEDPNALPMIVLNELGGYRRVPVCFVRLTVGSTGEPTSFFELTMGADPGLLIEGPNTRVRFRVTSEAPVDASDVSVSYEAWSGDVTLGAVTAEADNVFAVTANATDGKMGRGLVTVRAEDAVGNTTELAFPIWVVKEPLQRPEHLRVRMRMPTMPATQREPTNEMRTVTGADATPRNISNLFADADIRLGSLGLHMAEAELIWVADAGGADEPLGMLQRSRRIANSWEVIATGAGTEGAGKLVLRVRDHYGNDTRQEITGWHLDDTPPALGVAAAATTAANPQIRLTPAPSDTGSGVAHVFAHVERADGAGNTAVRWTVIREYTGGPIAIPGPVPPGNYNVTVWAWDNAGNRTTVNQAITVNP